MGQKWVLRIWSISTHFDPLATHLRLFAWSRPRGHLRCLPRSAAQDPTDLLRPQLGRSGSKASTGEPLGEPSAARGEGTEPILISFPPNDFIFQPLSEILFPILQTQHQYFQFKIPAVQIASSWLSGQLIGKISIPTGFSISLFDNQVWHMCKISTTNRWPYVGLVKCSPTNCNKLFSLKMAHSIPK